ncbi:hypothetical protein CYMTET_35359, partial [Cymbomonas tetramitiformis]
EQDALNSSTRERQQLQLSLEAMTSEMRALTESSNLSSNEKDRIARAAETEACHTSATLPSPHRMSSATRNPSLCSLASISPPPVLRDPQSLLVLAGVHPRPIDSVHPPISPAVAEYPTPRLVRTLCLRHAWCIEGGSAKSYRAFEMGAGLPGRVGVGCRAIPAFWGDGAGHRRALGVGMPRRYGVLRMGRGCRARCGAEQRSELMQALSRWESQAVMAQHQIEVAEGGVRRLESQAQAAEQAAGDGARLHDETLRGRQELEASMASLTAAKSEVQPLLGPCPPRGIHACPYSEAPDPREARGGGMCGRQGR